MEGKELMQAKAELDAKVIEIATAGGNMAGLELAKLANIPYDAEMPIPEVIAAVAKTDSVGVGEDYEYFVVSPETKVVYTITSGSINQTNVTPGTHSDLSFADYESDQYNVYVSKILQAKYNALEIKAKTAMESLNRKEIKDVLDLLIAAAEGQANTFANDSGDSAIDFEKIVDMARSVARYGEKLVLVAGADVYTDIILMPYKEDKNAKYIWSDAGIDKLIKVEGFQYTHSGTKTVLATDKALVVATSDSMENRCVDFVRRKSTSIDGSGEKERVIVLTGPIMQVSTTPKLAYGLVIFEQYGVVVTNPRCVAVYKNASVYA